MKIKQIHDFVKLKLKNSDIDSPALTAGVLLCHILKCDRTYLIAHDGVEVSGEDEKCIMMCVDRLCCHEPLDYVIGERGFMGMKFFVGKGVLIPRPETELLVEKAIEFVIKYGYTDKVNVLDLCTGSGCIVISIVKSLLDMGISCMGTGIDISPDALDFALKNAVLNNVSDNINIFQGNIMDIEEISKTNDNFYTVITINPPYILSGDIVNLDRKVREHEPVLALDGGKDGLDYYRRICGYAYKYLIKGGLLAFEIGYDQAEAVVNIITAVQRYCDIQVYKDLAGLERVVICRSI